MQTLKPAHLDSSSGLPLYVRIATASASTTTELAPTSKHANCITWSTSVKLSGIHLPQLLNTSVRILAIVYEVLGQLVLHVKARTRKPLLLTM